MRNLETEPFIDLAALTLRWLLLFCLSAWILNEGVGSPVMAGTLLAVAFWNASLTFLLFSGRRFDPQGYIRLGVDLLVANLLFFSGPARPGMIFLTGLLPVISAAMLLEWRGTLLAVLLTVFSLGIQILIFSQVEISLATTIWIALGWFAGGLAILYLRHVTIHYHEKIKQNQLLARQEAERSAEERTRILVKAGEILTRDLQGERVTKTALSLSAEILSPSPNPESQLVGAVLFLSESGSGEISLQVAEALRFSSTEESIRFSSTGGLITRTIEEGQPRLSKEVSKDPELYRFASLRACQAAYCIPLAGFGDPYPLGVLLLAHPDENIFTKERRVTLDAIGRVAGRAIRNAWRYRDLGLERERLVELLQENRSRLVRELHDGSTQSVSALALRANLIRRTFERDGKISVEELHKLEDLARTTAKEIRQMLFTLRPLEQKPVGLDTSLEGLSDNLRKSAERNVEIVTDPEIVAQLEPMKQAVIFYVAEEAIEIAHRNGNTEPVLVRVRPEEGELACLEVEYPGHSGRVGDVPASYENKNSLSVSNMRERAALVNGYLEIQSNENQEVKVRLLVPITERAAERIRYRQ